jgi:anti-sigma B factor antagonist
MQLGLTGFDAAGVTVLAVAGEVDVHTGPVLRARLAGLLDSGRRRVVVDLAGVDFLDSTGLAALVTGLNRAREIGGSLTLACPQERLVRLLRITGLDEVFVVYPTVADALADQPTA